MVSVTTRHFLAFLILSLLSACAPSMRITPGEIPPPRLVTPEEKSEAEAFVRDYSESEGRQSLPRGAEYARVKRIFDRLAKAAGYPPNTFPIHIVDAGDEVNAMVVSGSSVVVYKELLERVPRDEELAVILGHELGHALAGHHAQNEEQQSRAAAVSIGSAILGTITSVGLSAAGVGGAGLAGDLTETTAETVGYGAFVGSFDRRQEYEADHIGLLIMAKAGYDPRNATTFWSRSEEVFGGGDSSIGAFFSTHPASADRQEALAEAMPLALPYYSRR